MHDPNFIGAEFDYEEISKIIGSEKSYALGAGSGNKEQEEGHDKTGQMSDHDLLDAVEKKDIYWSFLFQDQMIEKVGTFLEK